MLTKRELAQNFILNIEKERIHRNLTQAQMAAKLEMSLSGYKKMISGSTTKINLHTMYLVHAITGKWLYEMIGEPDEDTDIIIQLKQLSSSQKRAVKDFINFELIFSSEHSNTDDYVNLYIPTGNMVDGMFFDSTNYKKVNISAYRKRFGSNIHCAIKVTSEHLHPVYNEGDILLISRNPIRAGDTGIFINQDTGRIYIRRMCCDYASTWVMESINDYDEPIIINKNDLDELHRWIRFGYVLTKMRFKNPIT